jgi:hypothetical protein
MRKSQPSPLWGRGWPATGVFISRGRTGEGVKPGETPSRFRQTRTLARVAGQTDAALEIGRKPTGTERGAGYLVRRSRLRGFKSVPGVDSAKSAELCLVACRGAGFNTFGFDPLTRPAPAGKSAGCGPPSPPGGRGQRLLLARFEMWKHQAPASAGGYLLEGLAAFVEDLQRVNQNMFARAAN